jgi:hypothetical protein
MAGHILAAAGVQFRERVAPAVNDLGQAEELDGVGPT